jgi:uncharacterized delta-60 repeat protein
MGPIEPLEPRRLMAAGQVDPLFGVNGIATAKPDPAGGILTAVFALPGGKLLGLGTNTGQKLAMVRLTESGTLDASFGNGSGTVIADVFPANSDFAVDPSSGRIATITWDPQGLARNGVAVFNADGTPDLTFNGTSKITPPADFAFSLLAFQVDGKLLIAGIGEVQSTAEADVSVRRYLIDGTPDASFGTNGRASVTEPDIPKALLVTPDGRFAVAGDYDHGDSSGHVFGDDITMFSGDGQLQWETPVLDFSGQIDRPASPQVFSAAVAPDSSFWVLTGAELTHLDHVLSNGELGPSITYGDESDFVPQQLDVDDMGRLLYLTGGSVGRLTTDGNQDPGYGDGVAPLGFDSLPVALTHQGDRAVAATSAFEFTRLQGGASTPISITLNRRGSLIVHGDGGDNAILVSRRPRDGRIIVRCHTGEGEWGDGDLVRSFPPARVRRIGIFAVAGDDHVTIGEGIARGCFIDAGAGADVVIGGAGGDYVLGGSGADRIDGGDGDDTLLGGDGSDSLAGGAGGDLLYGNGGIDTLNGNGGNDRLVVGGIDDVDRGDRIIGGRGSDIAIAYSSDEIISEVETLIDLGA